MSPILAYLKGYLGQRFSIGGTPGVAKWCVKKFKKIKFLKLYMKF